MQNQIEKEKEKSKTEEKEKEKEKEKRRKTKFSDSVNKIKLIKKKLNKILRFPQVNNY